VCVFSVDKGINIDDDIYYIVYTHKYSIYLPSTWYATRGYIGHYIQQPYYTREPFDILCIPKAKPFIFRHII